MSGSLRRAAALALCTLLLACSIGVGRGVDPRDSGGQGGAIGSNTGMGVPGALGMYSGSAILDWLTSKLLPNKRSDVPPPPASQLAGGERAFLEQDCTNPLHAPGDVLPCR